MLVAATLKRLFVLSCSLLVLFSCSPEASQQAKQVKPSISASSEMQFTLGEDYEIVRDVPSSTPKVVEHFSLYCIHCYKSEEMLGALKSSLAADIPFNRSHVLFLPQNRQEWARNMTFSFAAAARLGIEDEFVSKVFEYHFKDKVYLGEMADIKNIFVVLGKTSKEFSDAVKHEKTMSLVKQMAEQANNDKVRFTPDLIVNDKYRVKLGALHTHDDVDKRLAGLVKFLLTNP